MKDTRPGRGPWPRRLWIAATVLVVIAAVGSVALAWIIGERVAAGFAVPQPPRPDDLEIVAVEGDMIRYRDTRPGVGPADVGRLAIKLPDGGWVYTAEEVSTQGDVSARRIEKMEGEPPKTGDRAQFDLAYYPADPQRGPGPRWRRTVSWRR